MPNRQRIHLGRRLATGALLTAVAVLTVGVGALGAAPNSRARADDGGQSVRVTIPERTSSPGQAILACTGVAGGPLKENPTLHPGDQLTCTGTGFAPGEQVAIALGVGRELGTVSVGQDGTVRREISLPADLGAGRWTLTFTGETSRRTASFAFTVTLVASVPVGGGGGGGFLPRTGADLIRIAGAGVGLVALGGVLTVTGRRVRRRALDRFSAGPGGVRQ